MARRKINRMSKKRTRPQREPTTVVLRDRAIFGGIPYTVYAKRGTGIRTIFPRPSQHPSFAKAPFGRKFRVFYRGRWYYARKEARWQENGARVPCLVWTVSSPA